ncbi:MucR family transcriptional regulator [Bosea caraganae]|uniref:MucR family transcriptional regulator n=1 Tax=Bosea caraganae TaxID=2763117 RepID=A0A370KXK8_9HYPH|nr:MucR family transcriptional regulator [Bosea caraganae]RDJ19711.1 MucR family transcriptional regulator [Bosea caraganae]RDJ24355.1 MucR family transcriptional regulator [Bosea caraganae]
MPENMEELLGQTAGIISAYVAHNNVPRGDLAELIASTHAALAKLGGEPAPLPVAALVPAVPIRKSVTPDAIICLEDGKRFKSLKRHLSSKFDLTPEQYRARWGLPADYPMVAPNYAEARSALARSMGLGRKATPIAAPAPDPEPAKPTRAKRAPRAKQSA